MRGSSVEFLAALWRIWSHCYGDQGKQRNASTLALVGLLKSGGLGHPCVFRRTSAQACFEPLAGPVVEVELVVPNLPEFVPAVQQGSNASRPEDR